MNGFVIRLTNSTTPCWIDGSDGDPGITGKIRYAMKYTEKEAAEKEIDRLRRKYPRRQFEVEAVQEIIGKGVIIGYNFVIV